MDGFLWWSGVALWVCITALLGLCFGFLVGHCVQTTIFVWRARAHWRFGWRSVFRVWRDVFVDAPDYAQFRSEPMFVYWPGPRGRRARAKHEREEAEYEAEMAE